MTTEIVYEHSLDQYQIKVFWHKEARKWLFTVEYHDNGKRFRRKRCDSFAEVIDRCFCFRMGSVDGSFES